MGTISERTAYMGEALRVIHFVASLLQGLYEGLNAGLQTPRSRLR